MTRPVLKPINETRIQYVPRDAFGSYRFALKRFEYVENPETNKYGYGVSVEVMSYSPEAGVDVDSFPEVRVGRRCNLWLPVNQGPHPKYPKREEENLERVAKLIYAIAKVEWGTDGFDPNPIQDDLEALGEIEDNSMTFGMVRKSGKAKDFTPKDRDGNVKRDANGHVLIEKRQFPKDTFLID